MKKYDVTVKNYVPDWNYCNHHNMFQQTTGTVCRFCVKGKKSHVCALFNMPLDTEHGLFKKDSECLAACKTKSVVVEDVQIQPKDVIKTAIAEYQKLYKSLINQGYPDSMAAKLAQQTLLK